LTVDDFLNQRPSTYDFIQRDNFVDNINKPFFYYKHEKGKKGQKISSAFAVYNGDRWFKLHDGQGTLMSYRDGDFYLGRQLRFNPLKRKFLPVPQVYPF
jgi:hypothetical protein